LTAATIADLATGDASLVAARPYNFRVPTGYDPSLPTPLVILLHGYSANGAGQEGYFKLGPVADSERFLYAFPDGTIDPLGNRFWNATDSCCNFYASPVDDVAYLGAIIDDVSAKYNVDSKRVYLVGHSNGGFMAHRAACDLAPRIAAIVTLAGDNWKDGSRCQAADPVAVLEVHGDADTVIPYNGGPPIVAPQLPPAPSAKDSLARWAALDRCPGGLIATGTALDVDAGLPGAETRIDRYEGCPAGAAELWTIQGGAHVPTLQPTWAAMIYGFLKAHPKP
jgi:polyhydroxybutyrate depolymerase